MKLLEINLNFWPSILNLWNNHPGFRGAAGAAIIGALGSAAYLTAVLLGFLGDAPITQLRPRFEHTTGTPAVTSLSKKRIVLFAAFGGFVATVFQLPQGALLAPIQALVLGATWPTVLSQIMTKTGETEGDKIGDLARQIAGSFEAQGGQ
jgi:hypothetical protein